MPSVTITRVERGADGGVHVRFGKVGLQFASLADLGAYVREALTDDVLRALAVRAAAASLPASPTLPQLRAAFEGLTLTVTDATGVSRG